MRDELPGTDVEAPAHLRDGGIGDRDQHQIHVADGRRLQPAAPPPRGQDADARRRQRVEQRPRHRSAAEDGRGPDHSRRNSTPDPLAQARSVSPLFTRPARIASASGDSTRRWITWRIGRAPSAAW